jgi:plasmid stability protein
MASLQVRDLPHHIYQKLVKGAKEEHRSLAQQAIALLAKGLGLDESPQRRRAAIVRRIAERNLPDRTKTLTPPQDLLRQDRTR